MKGAVSIVATATAVPEHRASLADVKGAMRTAFRLDAKRHDALVSLLDGAQVDNRYSVLPFGSLAHLGSLGERNRLFKHASIALGKQVAQTCLDRAGVTARQVDFIVTVSCTGFMIPSLDAYLVGELGLRPDVRRLPITELGCLGGAAALARTADLLGGRSHARALVVAVELPSLCFQGGDDSPANLVSSALFGDGAAAALLTTDVGPDGPTGATIVDAESRLFLGTPDALGFDLRDDGFHAVLSRQVPDLLREHIGPVVSALLERTQVTRADLTSFVLHPGGRKVLAALESALTLAPSDTDIAREILRQYGNQSSASVFFVLDRFMTGFAAGTGPRPGSFALLGAFGPGLAAELMLLNWSHA